MISPVGCTDSYTTFVIDGPAWWPIIDWAHISYFENLLTRWRARRCLEDHLNLMVSSGQSQRWSLVIVQYLGNTLGSLRWHTIYVHVEMLASWQYTSIVDEETLLQSARAYCVCIPTHPVLIVSADPCHVASIVSVPMTGAVCILRRLVRFLYNH
ncbi:hypothetical protein CY34DRAFT_255487 [Suillus luteus UH-Slu-Lm8-n1]|uniref:Unplaced genomic scaffold CY34scaffold_163, whole genome shotgun sequence n=1 Tax=Suillus luteus UH-Slu-Lm8-n1 TaxID=930992 RepID=A0A0D0B2G5_9AGAM|nr:hypothetical protein CY34DRAFT_255487 [Suillus luteus UH-Slu-Lm8-n1]